MSEKKLWQVGWAAGQTEGDVSEQTVRDLINVELDVEGALYPRQQLSEVAGRQWSYNGTNDTPYDIKYMNNPLVPSELYRVLLYKTGVKILKDSDGSTVGTFLISSAAGWSGGASIGPTSSLEIHADNIYIAAMSTDSPPLPLGVFKLVYISAATRFRPPKHCTSVTGGNGEVAYAARWAMLGPDGLAPVLAVYKINEIWGQQPSNDKSAVVSNANTAIGIIPTKTKVALFMTRVLDRHDRTAPLMEVVSPMAVNRHYVCEYAVQFVYADGTHSALSNSVVCVSETNYREQGVGIGTTVGINSGISEVIAGINVYRRIMRADEEYSNGNAFELLYTADFQTTMLESKDVTANSAMLTKHWNKYEVTGGDLGHTIDDDANYGVTGLRRVNTGFNLITPGAGNRRFFSGLVSYTSGWFRMATYFADNPDTYLMVYCPQCLVAIGEHTVYAGTTPDTMSDTHQAACHYKLVVGATGGNDAVVVYGYEANVGSNVYCVTNSQVPLTPFLVPSGYGLAISPSYQHIGVEYADDGIVPAFSRRQTPTFGWDLFGAVLFQPANSTVHASYPDHPSAAQLSGNGTRMIDPYAIMFYVDYSQAMATLENVSGLTSDERSIVLPRRIAFGVGRMLCLNVDQDGVTKSSRLAYSEFRRFNAFRKSNYIDYGSRDDGVGVALGFFAGRLLVLHTTASYALDVSGGTDMAWREIASHTDIGCLSAKAMVVTSMGIFFADSFEVYWFDGERITKISDLEGRRVTAAYRAMNKANVTLAWRSDKRQLWVCDGSTVLVFDIDRGAWHKHLLTDAQASSHVVRFNDLAGATYLTAIYRSGNVSTFYNYGFSSSGLTTPFVWGVRTGPINMGASEIVKKSKSLYIDTVGATGTSGDFMVWYTNPDSANDKEFTPGVTRTVHRIKISTRKPWLDIMVLAKATGGVYWRGVVESVGLSFRPKRLK